MRCSWGYANYLCIKVSGEDRFDFSPISPLVSGRQWNSHWVIAQFKEETVTLNVESIVFVGLRYSKKRCCTVYTIYSFDIKPGVRANGNQSSVSSCSWQHSGEWDAEFPSSSYSYSQSALVQLSQVQSVHILKSVE